MLLSIYQNKSILVFLSAFLFSFLILSCKDEGTPPIELPEGYQKDISWLSLADSPWPMYHHDPQSTGRSKYDITLNGVIENKIEAINLQSSIIVSKDSTIYFALSGGGGILKAIKNGKQEWEYIFNNNTDIFLSPLMDKNGNIYVGTAQSGKIYSFNKTGNKNWEFSTGHQIWQTSLNIDKEGNLYFIDNSQTLYCISSNGDLNWSITDSRMNSATPSSVSFSPDGKHIYIPGCNGVSLLSFDITEKKVDWSFGEENNYRTPVVDSDGNIYLSTISSTFNSEPALFCIESNGNVKWFYPHNNSLDSEVRMNVPTIDKYGNIYYALDTIYSINHKGILNWKRKLDYINDCPLVCSNNCNVFVGMMKIIPNQFITVSAYNKEGNLLWQLSSDTDSEVGPSPALTPFGLFFPTWQSNNIISIK